MAVGWRRRFMVQAPVSQPVNSLDSTLMHCPLIKLRSPLRSALVTIIPKTCDKYRLEKKKASVYTKLLGQLTLLMLCSDLNSSKNKQQDGMAR
jgi:hypothetical protein